MTDASQNLTFSSHPVSFNQTLYDNPYLCTLSTCPKDYATLRYVPSLSGNAFYLALFTIMFLIQIGVGVWRRTWTFLIAMVGGCVLEVIGYGGRVAMHGNIFDFNWFLMFVSNLLFPCLLT